MKITGSFKFKFFQRRGIGWFFESATFKEPKPAVLQKLQRATQQWFVLPIRFLFL
jgi:hypothetical protein